MVKSSCEEGDTVYKLVVRLSPTDVDDAFEMDDGTGTMGASIPRFIKDETVESPEERIRLETTEILAPTPPTREAPKLVVNRAVYYRVFGKCINNSLEIAHFAEVADCNEVTTHLLECILDHCKRE